MSIQLLNQLRSDQYYRKTDFKLESTGKEILIKKPFIE